MSTLFVVFCAGLRVVFPRVVQSSGSRPRRLLHSLLPPDPSVVWLGACIAGALQVWDNKYGVPMGDLAAGLRTAVYAAEGLAPMMGGPLRAAWDAGNLGAALKLHPMFPQWRKQKAWGRRRTKWHRRC